ncbi:MAG: hypothetical protein ACKOSQ_05180 [Planctomycetaceae bacterium]
MRTLLLAAQVGDGDDRGSWFEGVDGLHGRMLGRLGCTALAAIILEIPVAPRAPRLL